MTKEEYNKNPLYCKQCGKSIPYKKRKSQGKFKFCNNTCSNLYYGSDKMSSLSRQKISKKSKVIQKNYWSEEKRKEHSDKMKSVVRKNPLSYSINNVCGRVKGITVVDSLGNVTKCLGSWEKCVVDFLEKNSIRWTNTIEKEFKYYWNGTHHRYFPDFYLIDKDVYLEVKGFERDRDREKWKSFPCKLIVLKKREINQIKNNTYTINNFI